MGRSAWRARPAICSALQPRARSVAELYRYQWQVELFFKWIKQHLRIKSFFGTSENAVKTQIWIAVTVYVLVAVLRKRLDLSVEFYTILQVLSLTLFEKMPAFKLFPTPTTIYRISKTLTI